MLISLSLHLVHFCKVLYCWKKTPSTTCSFTSKINVRLCDSLLTFHSKLTFRNESTSSVLYQQSQKFCKACTNTFCNLLQVSLHRNELKTDSQKRRYPDLCDKFKSIYFPFKGRWYSQNMPGSSVKWECTIAQLHLARKPHFHPGNHQF